MQTVVLIKEENHGMIGVAKDYLSAVQFLIDSDWLNENYEIWVDNEDYLTQSIKENLGENWSEIILTWDIEQFGVFFEGGFYLNIEEVYGTD